MDDALTARPGTPLALVLALLPLPFFLVAWYAAYRVMRCDDEMQRRIQLEALAFAYPMVMVAVMAVVMVRKAGYPVGFELVDVFWTMSVACSIGAVIAWQRYR